MFLVEVSVLSKQTREGVNIVGDDFMLQTVRHRCPSAPDASLKVSWKVKIGFGMVVS